MNEQPSGERPGDEESTDPSATRRRDDEPTTDQSVTDGHAAGDQTSDEHEEVRGAKGTPSMSMPAGRAASASGGAAASTNAPVSPSGRRGGTAVMVILALIVGALVGAGIVAATQSNDAASTAGTGSASSPSTAPSEESPSVGPTASPSTTVVIPAICLNLTDDAQAIVDLSTQAAEAARDLKASKLSSLVRQLDAAQQVLRDDTAACRAAGTNGS